MKRPDIKCIQCRMDQRLPIDVREGWEDDLCPEHITQHEPRCNDYSCGTCPRCEAARDFMREKAPDAIDLDERPPQRYDEDAEDARIFNNRKQVL